MHIITEKRLREFADTHADAEESFTAWIRLTRGARWNSLVDVRGTFPSADPVGDLTVFNIKGNEYRLITAINYLRKKVYIRAVLTHAEYTKNRWKNDPWYREAPFLH